MNFSIVGLLFQIIAAILSVVFYKKHKNLFYKLLCAFLVIVAITEMGGFYELKHKINNNNIIHYVSIYIQFVLMSLIYIILLKNKIISRLILIPLIVFTIVWAFGFLNIRGYFFNLVIYMCFNVSVLSFLYLRKLLMSEEILNYKTHLPFWVCVGFLIFYLPAIPFFTMTQFMDNRDLFFIIHYLIIFMNLFIIYGLIWSKKEVKY